MAKKSKKPEPAPAPPPEETQEQGQEQATATAVAEADPAEDKAGPASEGEEGQTTQLEVRYPEYYSEVWAEGASAADGQAFGPITVEKAKELLGWEEEIEGGPDFGEKYVKEVARLYGKKVRLANNVTNRPIYSDNVLKLQQEHLHRRWRFNGEPIIVGRYGRILNGQHALIALVLAEAARTGPQSELWGQYWDIPVTMDKVIVFGVSEDDDVINTMDTCRPRSLSDVIYRSPYFSTKTGKDRKSAAKILEYAIKFLWSRTRAMGSQAFPIYQTHAEALDFLARHNGEEGWLLRATEHILKENGDGNIQKYVSAGYAAGMLYLMATCASDKDVYLSTHPPTADTLDFSYWPMACEFFIRLSSHPTFHELRMHLNSLPKADVHERIATLVKAWNVWLDKTLEEWGDQEGAPEQGANYYLNKGDFQVAFHFDDDGNRRFDEFPDVGGIDQGPLRRPSDEEAPPLTPDEIEAAKMKEKEAGLEKTRDEYKARQKVQANGESGGEDSGDDSSAEEEVGEEADEFDPLDEEEVEEQAQVAEAAAPKAAPPVAAPKAAPAPRPAAGPATAPDRPGKPVPRPAPASKAEEATGWKAPPTSTRKPGTRGPRG